ncbi:hypothetical protein SAMN04487884_12317 [Butyrivibrio fibrisolvens]|uniref:Bacterial Pleckstrin homology domain-containing protein n=1 Tax=Butyrivibrio fibrisolvens TaxID=831 RepID=A0A1H9VHH1_BUTFI|nr:hypothetical protein [Butyrivibrio fibrisolvens]SES20667.1 hypothetical protein SAMN04487884_12317 [Butyrivibrio fibrisolvens]
MKDMAKEIRRQWILTIIFVAVIALIVFVKGSRVGGKITVQVNDKAIGISGENHQTIFVMMDDVTSIDLTDLEGFDAGHRIEGENTANLYEGVYENAEYGRYRAVIGADSGSLIVVKTKDETIVFSGLSKKDTVQIYDEIIDKMS